MAKGFKSINFAALLVPLMAPLTMIGLSGCFYNSSLSRDITQAHHGSRIEDSAQNVQLTVTNRDGSPISGARVLIGTRQDVPFSGNLLTTDSTGKASAPIAWIDPQPITIEAPGFVRTTYFGRLPQTSTFTLRASPPAQKHQLTGETSGYSNLSRDGFIDIGIVTPALTRAEANTLQMGLLISPETETMSVVGQSFEIPSNVAFPTQKESIILPITFSKPVYRMNFDEARTWRIAAVHARFPLRDVMNEMNNGKGFFDVVNLFEFREASIREIPIKGKVTANLPINEIQYSASFPVTAPAYDAKYSMISVSLANDRNLFYLADVKRLDPNQKMNLRLPKATDGIVVNILQNDDASGATAEEMSAAVIPANQSQAVEFLPVATPPALRGNTLVLNPPRAPSSISPLVTHAILSKVEVSEKDGAKVENKLPQWELYAEEWASSLTLPEMPGSAPRASEPSRWTVLFGGQAAGSVKEPAGPAALEKVSHATRSAVDL